MRIGEYIRNYRDEHHMSQRTFASRAGLSNAQISFLERGYGARGETFEPSFDTIRKCARAMSITPEALLTACDDFNITLKSSDTSRDEFDKRRKEYSEAIAEIETPPSPDLPSDWLELYDRLSPEQKNVLWKTTLDHIVVDHDRVHLVFESAKVLAERMSML